MNRLIEYLQIRFANRPGLQRILDNLGWLLFDRILRVLVGMVVTVSMARYLGPEQFGIVSYALALTALFGMIALLGLTNVVVHELVENPRIAGTTLGSSCALMAVGGFVGYLALVACVLLTRADDEIAKLASFVIGASILFRCFEIGYYWFESQIQSKYVVRAQAVVFLLASGVKLALIGIGAPLIAFILVLAAQAAATPLVATLVFQIMGPGVRSLQFELERARELFRASWPMLMSGVAMMVYMKIDQLMIASIWGDAAVGVYSASVTVSEATYILAVIVTATAYPAILSSRKEGVDIYRTRFQQLLDIMVVLALGVAIPMTLLSDWVVNTLFGSSYSEAADVLKVHIWALLFIFIGVVSNRWFIAEGRQILNLQRTTLGAVVNIALNALWIPRFGLLGAAYATIVAHAVAAFLSDLIRAESRPLFRMKLAAFNVVGALSRLGRNL